jgi:protease-4
MLCLAFTPACSPTGSFKITAMPADQTIRERVVDDGGFLVSNRVAVIDISGMLMNAHEMGLLSEGEHSVSFAVEKLTAAAKDSRVKGIVLRINSPGGTVTASDMLYEQVLEFKKKSGKPVVAFFQDVAASGGYYTACGADEIIAQRTSVTGSIGVIMLMPNLTGTMAKLGITADAIKSGPLKDAGSPLRDMEAGEREVFQGMVDSFYGQFLDVVAAGRPKLTREQILKIADGRVYTSPQALEVGLIDRIGTLKDAVEAVKSRAKITAAHTVVYHRPQDWKPNIYAQSPVGNGTTVNLVNIDVANFWTNQPRIMYIWQAEGWIRATPPR